MEGRKTKREIGKERKRKSSESGKAFTNSEFHECQCVRYFFQIPMVLSAIYRGVNIAKFFTK